MNLPHYAPEFQIFINDSPVPASLRASITSVTNQSGLNGSDRVEMALVNENFRWLDHPLLSMGNTLALSLGYVANPLAQVFVGEIVGQNPSFPGGSIPTLTVVAQDRLQRLQKGNKVRWFAIPAPPLGHLPLPDAAIAGIIGLENFLIPVFEPVGATLSVLIGGAEIVASLDDPIKMQKNIRKQAGESDFDFLEKIAVENGWDMFIDHSGPAGGYTIRFLSSLDSLSPDLTLKYGESLLDFNPRISSVGQIAGVSVKIWRPEIKMEFTVTVGWNWDSQSLDLSIVPGFGLPGVAEGTPEELSAAAKNAGSDAVAGAEAPGQANVAFTLVEEPVTALDAPRIILSKLIPRLNQRLTGSGSTVGDPRIRPGGVLRLEGLGEQFGGLYRVTSATHTIDSGGYRTNFEVRKEIWFGSIPPAEQGAIPVSLQGQGIG